MKIFGTTGALALALFSISAGAQNTLRRTRTTSCGSGVHPAITTRRSVLKRLRRLCWRLMRPMTSAIRLGKPAS